MIVWNTQSRLAGRANTAHPGAGLVNDYQEGAVLMPKSGIREEQGLGTQMRTGNAEAAARQGTDDWRTA